MTTDDEAREFGYRVLRILRVVVISLPLWYVTRRKRRISATRLNCRHCGYIPHDTEISEVADMLRFPRC